MRTPAYYISTSTMARYDVGGLRIRVPPRIVKEDWVRKHWVILAPLVASGVLVVRGTDTVMRPANGKLSVVQLAARIRASESPAPAPAESAASPAVLEVEQPVVVEGGALGPAEVLEAGDGVSVEHDSTLEYDDKFAEDYGLSSPEDESSVAAEGAAVAPERPNLSEEDLYSRRVEDLKALCAQYGVALTSSDNTKAKIIGKWGQAK